MQQKSLFEFLAEIPDFRRKAGKRHDLKFNIAIIIMSVMSGQCGIRAIGEFAKNNKKELIKRLKPPKDRIPSYSTIRRTLLGVEFNELSNAFYKWAVNYVAILEKEWVSIDGKAIKSTLTDYNKDCQDFISLVTVFSHKRRIALANKDYQNKKKSEINIVEELIEMLDLEGTIISLDALHCQKNSKKNKG